MGGSITRDMLIEEKGCDLMYCASLSSSCSSATLLVSYKEKREGRGGGARCGSSGESKSTEREVG